MVDKAILEWNTMGLNQEFIDDSPPPDEGRNFYSFFMSEGLKAQINTWGGCDDYAQLWGRYLCNAMSIGVLPFPPRLLFLFTMPVELASGPAFCSSRDSVSLYKRTPFLMAGDQPRHRDAILFNSWEAFGQVSQQSIMFNPLWDWAISNVDQQSWWVITVDPSVLIPDHERDGKICQQ